MSRLLDSIDSPADLRPLSPDQLTQLAGEVRELIIDVVSRNGGHLASNLGTVELTLALHRSFDLEQDRLIWDCGHQCYAHKILTGRRDRCDARVRSASRNIPTMPASLKGEPALFLATPRRAWLRLRRSRTGRLPRRRGYKPNGYVSGMPAVSCVFNGATACVWSNQMNSSNWAGTAAWK